VANITWKGPLQGGWRCFACSERSIRITQYPGGKVGVLRVEGEFDQYIF
jgi:hypothetical protein